MYILYSEETSRKNIFNEFNDLFMLFLKKDKLSENDTFLLRCCLALFHIYLNFLVNPEQKITNAWNNQIKPLICKKYPLKENENDNTDVEFLILEIDKINNKNNDKQENINDIRMNTIYVSSNNFLNKGDNSKNINKNIKLSNNKAKVKNKTASENCTIKKNQTIVIKNDIKKKGFATLKLKKNEKINMDSWLLKVRKKFNLALKFRKNKSLDDKELRKFTLVKSFNLNQYADEVYIKDKDDIHKKAKKTILEKKSFFKLPSISTNYVDENNTEKSLRYKNKEFKAISFNYLLKQIITTNFLEKEENIEFIYAFCQQCFCFVKSESLFQKIINCYNYYKKMNTPFNQLKQLIFFVDLLTIEMVSYYQNMKISYDKNIIKFYKSLETDFMKILDNVNKISEIKENMKAKELRAKKTAEFWEKIKIFEEFQGKKNKANIINKEENKKIIKEKEKKTEDELTEKVGVLNEILNFHNILNNQENKFHLEIIKNNIKLYSDYKKVKNKQKKIFINDTFNIKSSKIPLGKQRNNYMICFSILNYEPEEIGEALITISKNALNKIERRELYRAIFLKKNKEKKCPNIVECITNFNKLTSFIMEDILSYDYPKIRAKVIYKWLKVANYLKQRKDHNDCFAIFSAINHYAITGLQLTKKEMKLHYISLEKKIKEYCSFEGNYKNFREEIRNCVKKDEFFVPYLGLLLRDISFYEAKYDYILDDGLINVEKIKKIQEIVDEFFYFKNINDENKNVNKYPEELNFFKRLEIIKEDDLEILANQLEPKFILTDFPQKIKRLTKMDIKYFQNKTYKDVYNPNFILKI